MNFTLQKINEKKIKPLPVKAPKPSQIVGYDVIPLLSATIYCVGRKGQGKTNIMFKILESCIDKNTEVIFFSSTHNADEGYATIKNWLIERDQPHVFFSSTINEDRLSNVVALTERMESKAAQEQEQERNRTRSKHSNVPKSKLGLFDDAQENNKQQKPHEQNKKVAPKYFIVFDDLSNELRKTHDLQTLFKHMRHYGCKIVICSQSPKDIDPPTAAQVDFWCIFRGFGKENMEEVFDKLDFSDLEFEDFYKIYLFATDKPHHFLYVDRVHSELRMDFDQKINSTIKK